MTVVRQGSLVYELLTYFNVYYVYLWLIFEFFIFIYKGKLRHHLWAISPWASSGLNLPYPQSIIAGEIIMVFLLTAIDRMRLFMSSRPPLFPHDCYPWCDAGSLGNKTERLGPVVGAVILGAFAIAGYCYFIRLQVYV